MDNAFTGLIDNLNKTVTGLAESVKHTAEKVDKLGDDSHRKTPFPGGAPHARRGEDPMTSRPYSYMKAMGVLAGQVEREDAKVEYEMHGKLKSHLNGWQGYPKSAPGSFFVPFSADFIPDNDALAAEVKAVIKGQSVDPDEYQYTVKKLINLGIVNKDAMSWLNEPTGGQLVAPPQFGELIDLLRPNAALLSAGARVIPLPPNGRITFPRQLTTTAVYEAHENGALTVDESNPTFGDVILTAKKLMAFCRIPNDLFRFSSLPVEAIIREDLAKTLALTMDRNLLENLGSATAPKGLINYNIAKLTSMGVAADSNSGYKLHPKDPLAAIATVEEANAEFKSWICRPTLFADLSARRADAVSAGDEAGPFLFNIVRDLAMTSGAKRLEGGSLNGYPVYKSTNVSKNRTRGTGTTKNTYLLGGDFSDFLVAMSGAMEFAVSTQGMGATGPFQNDQTVFRVISYYDGAVRREASFAMIDNVLQGFGFTS